jgi:hypothetical protein
VGISSRTYVTKHEHEKFQQRSRALAPNSLQVKWTIGYVPLPTIERTISKW